jgi:hypothetical protein
MRKTITLVMAVALFMGSASLNYPARADLIEYTLLLAFVALASAAADSQLPQPQKDRLIRTIESWKSLPPTKENLAYVEKHSAQIKKLLATANDPKSQAALQKYTTTAYFKPPQPSKVQMHDVTITKTDKSSVKLMTTTPKTTTTTTPSVLNNRSILGSGGAASGASGSSVKHATTPVTTSGHQ